MALRAQLESLEGVDDSLKAHYKKGEDGKYYIDVDNVDVLPTVRGLISTLKKFKEVAPDANSLRDRLAELKTLQEERDQLKQQLEEEAKKGGGERVKERERLIEAHKAELQKRDEKVGKLETFIRRLVVDQALTDAIERVGVKPEYRPAVKALLRERGPQVIAEGDTYRGIFRTDLGDIPIADYVAQWASREEAAAYLPPSGNKGSGAPGIQPGSGAPGAKQTLRVEKGMVVADPEKVFKGEIAVAAE